MPYVEQNKRHRAETYGAHTAGELNYLLTCCVDDYMKNHGMSYASMNDVIGALEGAKLEFYRRVVVPYEDKKMKENGDVYGCQQAQVGPAIRGKVGVGG